MSSTPPDSHPPRPPRNGRYNSLPSTLTSAFSWTFKALTSPSNSPPAAAVSEGFPLPPTAAAAAAAAAAVVPPSRTGGFSFTPPPLPGLRIPDSSRLLTRTLAEEIRLLLPPRLQLHDTWRLAYSLEQHGVSLATLYKRSETARGAGSGSVGFVLVVRDSLGGIFGAFVNEPLRPRHGYYGTGECFLWKARLLPNSDPTKEEEEEEKGEEKDQQHLSFRAFPYSGVNDYMILCDGSYLSVGGGDGKYGLWLDSTLEKGVSASCPTFGNEPLSEDIGGKFEVLDVELWRVGGNQS